MEEKSVVEWYGKEMGLLFQQFQTNKITITEFHYKRLELEDNAKEMEKEQIIDAYSIGCINGEMIERDIKPKYTNPIQYYNETFKSE